MKKLTAVLTALLMLSGCGGIGINNNITGLLSSPKHSQTESLIAQEIGDYLGENITLKYSQTQGYSAPIQFIDIDGDNTDEALVFYYAPNKGTNIRFALLKYTDEEWNIVFDKEGLGAEVFYFDTIKLEGLEGQQILVGYLPVNISGNFFVTYFTDHSVQSEDYVEVCEEIFVADVTDDGYDDVILTNILYDNRIRVKVIAFGQDHTFKTAGTKVLKRGDVQITQMTVSKTYDGKHALYIDYTDSYNKLYTEAGILQGTAIVNCLSEDTVGREWEYHYKLNSFDIDYDGVQEIPVAVLPEEAEQISVLRFIQWSDYSQNPQQIKLYGVYDTAENIFVAVPQEWQPLIHTQYNTTSWQIVSEEDNAVLVKFAKQENSIAAEDNYSYNVNIGTDVWNIKFHESVQQQQIDFMLGNITAFK